MIEISSLTYTYNNSPEPSLKNIDLKIEDGEFVLLTGPSGSGKSTLVRLLNSLIPHYYGGIISGSVKVLDFDASRTSTRKLAGNVGMVFQNPENQMLLSNVESEIAFGMENLNFNRKIMEERMEEMLNVFKIKHLRKKHSSELSGGEKQKVAIASVLAMNPKILILDEPTAELDPQSSREILDLIHDLNINLGLTIILIEHRLDRVADFVDRIVVLNEGRIIFDGSTKNCFYNGVDLDLIGIETPPVIKLFKEFLKKHPTSEGYALNLQQCKNLMRGYLGTLKIEGDYLSSYLDLKEKSQLIQNQPIVIELVDVQFEYKKENFSLQNINLKIYQGEFISIIGRNGSGKTSLAKLMNGLLRPKKGKILINNSEISEKSVAELSHTIGYIFQNPSIQFYQDTVENEFQFVLKNFNFKHDEIKTIIDTFLDQFELTKYKQKYPRNLSIGEQQKTALASVLSIKPKILILDEPTHGMDYRQKIKFMQQLDKYRNQGNTVIIITHDVETIAEYSDRVILLQEGKIIEDDMKRTVLSKYTLFSPQINLLVKNFDNIPNNILTVNDMLEVMKFEKE